MAKREDVFPSKYLKASDLGGEPRVVLIASAPVEVLKAPDGKEERKTVLYFRTGKKVLPLNRTNWDRVAEICGEDSDDWPGQSIELYPTKTEMRGDIVDCIRVRAPSAQDEPEAAPTAPQSKPKAKRKKAGTAKPSVADEMGDEIPF